MHAALPREHPVRVPAPDDEGRRRDACFLAFRTSSTSTSNPRLRPPRVHAQQHLGPVLRVGTARAGVDLADRVALVVLAAEERAQFEPVELAAQRDALVDLGFDRVVALLAPELEQRLQVGEAPFQLVDQLDVVAARATARSSPCVRGPGRPRGRARRLLRLELGRAASARRRCAGTRARRARGARDQPGPR